MCLCQMMWWLSLLMSCSWLSSAAEVDVCLCDRRDCYRCITETLDYLLSTGQQFPQAPSVPRVPGPPPVHDPGRLSGAEAEKYVITSGISLICFVSRSSISNVVVVVVLLSLQIVKAAAAAVYFTQVHWCSVEITTLLISSLWFWLVL